MTALHEHVKFCQLLFLFQTDPMYKSMLCRSVLAVSMVATCVELGFSKGAPVKGSKAKAQATEVVKAEPTPDTKPELVAEHIPEKESWTSALIVAITFSAAGAFAELGLGYLEAKFKFLNYGRELAMQIVFNSIHHHNTYLTKAIAQQLTFVLSLLSCVT